MLRPAGHLFPYLPKQPGYHKRLVAAAPLICKVMLHLAALCPSWHDDLRLLDATPVPCGTSRQTVRRSALAGWANYGYCAAHSRCTFKDQLGLERHGGRTPTGVFARIAQRLLALAACIWHNWTIRTTGLRSLTAYDH